VEREVGGAWLPFLRGWGSRGRSKASSMMSKEVLVGRLSRVKLWTRWGRCEQSEDEFDIQFKRSRSTQRTRLTASRVSLLTLRIAMPTRHRNPFFQSAGPGTP
jgi:hypothetical protein